MVRVPYRLEALKYEKAIKQPVKLIDTDGKQHEGVIDTLKPHPAESNVCVVLLHKGFDGIRRIQVFV